MNRRTFLTSLVMTAGGVLIPDWGQRVFPMFQRTKRRYITTGPLGLGPHSAFVDLSDPEFERVANRLVGSYGLYRDQGDGSIIGDGLRLDWFVRAVQRAAGKRVYLIGGES